jgi:hypothetical protein
VAELQRTSQRNYHWRIDVAQTALAIGVLCCSLLEFIFQCAGRERLRGYAAGQGSVVVDVELQQVEERVVDKVDRAVDVLLYAEKKLERAACFVAGWEWNVGELACSVGNVLAGITDGMSVKRSIESRHQCSIHGPVQTADGYLLADTVPLLYKWLLGSFCSGERGVKGQQDAHKE